MTTPIFVGQLKEFSGSCEVWHDVREKIIDNEHIILDSIGEKLKVADYSPKVKRYVVFYTCLAPESKFHEPEEGRYYPREKKIFQTFNLNHSQILQASDSEVLAIMAQKYLDGILKVNSFWGMKSTPFDTDKFYQDVKQIFESEGFI